MFDRLDWYEIILLLAPVALLMTWVKRREVRQNGVDFKALSSSQKIWMFVTLLPPGLSATLLSKMNPGEREQLLNEGQKIKGRAGTASLPLMAEFLRNLGEEKKVKANEVSEVLDFLEARFHASSTELLAAVKDCWK